jgi:hypothetical protein
MRAHHKPIIAGVVALATVIAALVLIDARTPVSPSVLSYTTNQWSDDLATQRGRTYVCTRT